MKSVNQLLNDGTEKVLKGVNMGPTEKERLMMIIRQEAAKRAEEDLREYYASKLNVRNKVTLGSLMDNHPALMILSMGPLVMVIYSVVEAVFIK